MLRRLYTNCSLLSLGRAWLYRPWTGKIRYIQKKVVPRKKLCPGNHMILYNSDCRECGTTECVFCLFSTVCKGQQFSVAAACRSLSGTGSSTSGGVVYVPGYEKFKELQQLVCLPMLTI